MPHQVDRALYARKPGWHGMGTVKEEGMFSAREALHELDPDSYGTRKGRVVVYVKDDNGNEVAVELGFEDQAGIVGWDYTEQQFRGLSIMARDYGNVQLDDLFEAVDLVVGAVEGSHYEAAVKLRKGKQVVLTVYLGDYVLDPGGIADKGKRFLWAFNSWDGSWALRFKFGDFRIECANMAAMALRGSSDTDVVGTDWSTRHTPNIMQRVNEIKSFLGLWSVHEKLYEAQAEHMIHTALDPNAFTRIIDGLFEVKNKETGQLEVDREATTKVRTVHELSASSADIRETIWGGFNAVTEYHDWMLVPRGSKTASSQERRFVNQVEDPKRLKQRAWDEFWNLAQDVKPFTMPDLADA